MHFSLAWTPARLASLVCLLACAVAGAPRARAQAGAFDASATVPADHWAVQAAIRAEALGLADGFLPPRRSMPRHIVAEALSGAAEKAHRERPDLAPLVDAWLGRLHQEFPELATGGSGIRRHGGYAYGSMAGETGRAGPGRRFVGEEGATPLAAEPRYSGGAGIAGGIGSRVAVLVQPELSSEGVEVVQAELIVGSRGLAVSASRGSIGYGYGAEGVVLAGRNRLDVIQIETTRPFRLGGALRGAGLFAVHAFVTRLPEPRHPGTPYLWGVAGLWRPHPRVTMAIHRASIMGGDSVDTPVTLRNVLRTFMGHNLLGFENEVVAAHFRWRLPTDAWIPAVAYGEWGAEDAAGGWRDVPGRSVGLHFPALPGVPALAMGAEYASFSAACCGNPPWYRHPVHVGGWANDGNPLGHSLGGHGRQWLGFAHLDLHGSGVRIDARGFTRERLSENLFVPGRAGRSRGGSLELRWRSTAPLELSLSGLVESGTGWSERAVRFGAVAFF